MIEMPAPPLGSFFWELPPPKLPLRAVGAMIMDSGGMTVANCPNASYADAIAWAVNDRYCPQVHGTFANIG